MNAKDDWAAHVEGALAAEECVATPDLEWDAAVLYAHNKMLAQDKRIAELEAENRMLKCAASDMDNKREQAEWELDKEVNRFMGLLNQDSATIRELETMIYCYVDGADIALEHNHIMRRVIENVQRREREE